jgi:hypothetical protein
MDRLTRPALILSLILWIAFIAGSLSSFKPIQSVQISEPKTGALSFQATATPQLQEDKSEIGSTDEITVMSFIIAGIILIPIFLNRWNWPRV